MATLRGFIQWCEQLAQSTGNPVARKIGEIFHNVDATNRQGHIKQAFYGVKAFLDEDPQRLLPFLLASPNGPLQLQRSECRQEWVRFLHAHADDPINRDGASIRRLKQVLSRRLGGVQHTGGGGDYELKLLSALAPRYLATTQYRR